MQLDQRARMQVGHRVGDERQPAYAPCRRPPDPPGDKAGKWNRWYAEAIPRAEQLYEIHLKERAEEEKER